MPQMCRKEKPPTQSEETKRRNHTRTKEADRSPSISYTKWRAKDNWYIRKTNGGHWWHGPSRFVTMSQRRQSTTVLISTCFLSPNKNSIWGPGVLILDFFVSSWHSTASPDAIIYHQWTLCVTSSMREAPLGAFEITTVLLTIRLAKPADFIIMKCPYFEQLPLFT